MNDDPLSGPKGIALGICRDLSAGRGPKDKDWNGLAKRFGIEAVRTHIQEGLAG